MFDLTNRALRALRASVCPPLCICCLTWMLSGSGASASETDASARAASAQVAPAPQGVVNLNTANAEELERLPGIGPARARAILALRAQLQKFTRVEQLLRVKGIGRATFRKLRPWLTLEGPTTLSASR